MTAFSDLTRLVAGDRIQEPFLVLDVETRGGDHPHTVLVLGNPSGRVRTAPFWTEELARIAGIARRSIVQVAGEVCLFRHQPQLRITSIRALPPGATPPGSLLPSLGDVEPYWCYLDRIRADVRAPRLRGVLALFYDDDRFRSRYEQCPAATAGHHAELGGLLKHTGEVAEIGLAMAGAVGADPDLVAAGALLHDIGKLDAYRWDGTFEPTELNALVGHVVLGALMLERVLRGQPTPPCTELELTLLTHLILSHHGKAEFGAPIPPLTLEAEVLHYADNASAKTASMAHALRDAGQFPDAGLISAPIWQLERRRVYRGRSDWGREG